MNANERKFVLPPRARAGLIAIALFGLLGPNGVFIYYALFRSSDLLTSLQNPVTIAFVAEAFVVMALLAVFLAHRPLGKWGWKPFVVLSLLGGLGFSVPALVVLNSERG